ncbi:MAG: DUF3137 domain-containing protein [Cyanobacteria bacterium J06600_6]
MDRSLSVSEIDRLYIQGDRNLHQGEFESAIATFETLLEQLDADERLYFDVQRSLIKAYQQNEEVDKAIALCQSVAASEIASTALWGQNFLAVLSPEFFVPTEVEAEATTPKQSATPKIKPKTLAEFKQFCQDNLLAELKALESKRKHTLRTIFGSAIVCLILPRFLVWVMSNWIRIINPLPFYLLWAIVLISAWIVFCKGAIYSYRVGFKRNVIENIVDFIGERDWLHYAAHLFIENKRQTIEALTRSQIIRNELHEPDHLEQEDCVYGEIGETEIFFAEIFAENRLGGHLDEFGREEYLRKSILFHGLFFEARFAKNFVSRTFVMPNDVKNNIPLINSWRGDLINLEDPEFEHLFKVYGDNQIESRYLLSTNLMSRLVEFNRKAERKVYLSFIDGFLYIAIPYRHRLFEPRLFKSMMSFTPLKEYFLDLQLMIGIVEDLNLNRRIWQ